MNSACLQSSPSDDRPRTMRSADPGLRPGELTAAKLARQFSPTRTEIAPVLKVAAADEKVAKMLGFLTTLGTAHYSRHSCK
jgi:hypothetical protein